MFVIYSAHVDISNRQSRCTIAASDYTLSQEWRVSTSRCINSYDLFSYPPSFIVMPTMSTYIMNMTAICARHNDPCPDKCCTHNRNHESICRGKYCHGEGQIRARKKVTKAISYARNISNFQALSTSVVMAVSSLLALRATL